MTCEYGCNFQIDVILFRCDCIAKLFTEMYFVTTDHRMEARIEFCIEELMTALTLIIREILLSAESNKRRSNLNLPTTVGFGIFDEVTDACDPFESMLR